MPEIDELKPHRTLTDDDVSAIVTSLRAQIAEQFYKDLGRGVMGYLAKGLMIFVLIIAAYGAGKGDLPFIGGHH